MREFRQIVEDETKALKELWLDWTNIQTDMVCLAIEVLGSAGIVVREEDQSRDLRVKVDTAGKRYFESISVHESVLDDIKRLDTSAQEVTETMFTTLIEQQKVRDMATFPFWLEAPAYENCCCSNSPLINTKKWARSRRYCKPLHDRRPLRLKEMEGGRLES